MVSRICGVYKLVYLMTHVSYNGTKIPLRGIKVSVIAIETNNCSQTILRLQIRAALCQSDRLQKHRMQLNRNRCGNAGIPIFLTFF